MNKLQELRTWFSLSETAKHLSTTLNQEVIETDIVQLSIDGYLAMSVRLLTSTEGIEITGNSLDSLVVTAALDPDVFDKPHIFYHSPSVSEGVHIGLERVETLTGVFELYQDETTLKLLENKKKQINGESTIPMDSIDGICLISSSGKTLILVQPHDFMIDLGPEVIIVRNESSHIFEYSEGALPSNSELCITRENLKRFCESKLLADHISPTKENNLRLVIGLLTKALVDKSGPKCGSKDNPNYQALSEMLQEYLPTDGLGTPSNKSLSTETLRKNLKKSYDILYDE